MSRARALPEARSCGTEGREALLGVPPGPQEGARLAVGVHAAVSAGEARLLTGGEERLCGLPSGSAGEGRVAGSVREEELWEKGPEAVFQWVSGASFSEKRRVQHTQEEGLALINRQAPASSGCARGHGVPQGCEWGESQAVRSDDAVLASHRNSIRRRAGILVHFFERALTAAR